MTAAPANRLRDLRRRRALSRTELARDLGVSSRTLRAIETGAYTPSLTLALRLARLLDLPVETVFQP